MSSACMYVPMRQGMIDRYSILLEIFPNIALSSVKTFNSVLTSFINEVFHPTALRWKVSRDAFMSITLSN